jgi:hypothetical protein
MNQHQRNGMLKWLANRAKRYIEGVTNPYLKGESEKVIKKLSKQFGLTALERRRLELEKRKKELCSQIKQVEDQMKEYLGYSSLVETENKCYIKIESGYEKSVPSFIDSVFRPLFVRSLTSHPKGKLVSAFQQDTEVLVRQAELTIEQINDLALELSLCQSIVEARKLVAKVKQTIHM